MSESNPLAPSWSMLTRPVGPFPVWAWGVVALGLLWASGEISRNYKPTRRRNFKLGPGACKHGTAGGKYCKRCEKQRRWGI